MYETEKKNKNQERVILIFLRGIKKTGVFIHFKKNKKKVPALNDYTPQFTEPLNKEANNLIDTLKQIAAPTKIIN